MGMRSLFDHQHVLDKKDITQLNSVSKGTVFFFFQAPPEIYYNVYKPLVLSTICSSERKETTLNNYFLFCCCNWLMSEARCPFFSGRLGQVLYPEIRRDGVKCCIWFILSINSTWKQEVVCQQLHSLYSTWTT